MPSVIVVAVYRIPGRAKWRCTAAVFDILLRTDEGIGAPIPLDTEHIAHDDIAVRLRRNALVT